MRPLKDEENKAVMAKLSKLVSSEESESVEKLLYQKSHIVSATHFVLLPI